MRKNIYIYCVRMAYDVYACLRVAVCLQVRVFSISTCANRLPVKSCVASEWISTGWKVVLKYFTFSRPFAQTYVFVLTLRIVEAIAYGKAFHLSLSYPVEYLCRCFQVFVHEIFHIIFMRLSKEIPFLLFV